MQQGLSNLGMRDRVADLVSETLEQLVREGMLPEGAGEISFTVEKPRDPDHGDLATNAALILGSTARTSPREIAEKLCAALEPQIDTDDHLSCVEVAGPGFINFRFSQRYLIDLLVEVGERGDSYGKWDRGGGRRVLVEFVSANPTGPLVVVQARSAAIGDVLCRLLRHAGYDAHSEYYVNDAGRQVQKLGLSVSYRLRQLEGEDVQVPEDAYPGEYVLELARGYAAEHGDQKASIDELGQYAAARLVSQARELLKRYRVEFDSWYYESEVRKQRAPREVLDLLQERGYLYEHEGAVWLKSSELGDDKDRVLVKSDGSYTYLLPDLAYHKNKMDRGFEWLIDILGPDHHGYVARMQAGLSAMGYPDDALTVLLSQWVRLLRGGEEISMSKRAGTFIPMEELLDDVGVDAARFFFVMRSPSSPLDFDLDLARAESSENPVYYAQYAHARICSVLEEAESRGMGSEVAAPEVLSLLDHHRERALMRTLGDFPGEVLGAAESLEPQRIASYVLDAASHFHLFYTDCRILGDDPDLSRARLYLARACRQVLASALHLLGVEAPKRM